MRTADQLRKERLRSQKQNIYTMSSPSSVRKKQREAEWFYSYRRDKERLKSDKKRNLIATERQLLLPPLPKRTFPGQLSKRANDFPPTAKTKNHKMFPKYLPKIEARKAAFNEQIKDFDSASRRLTNTENTVNKKLPPLAKRIVEPVRAALTSSATMRGLVKLRSEEQFIFRFRFSNYDVKDINTANLNAEPV